jgi:hypothetical protein
MNVDLNRTLKSAIVTMFFAGVSSSIFADHTVVNNLQCVRDTGVIKTTWTVVDSTQKYGGDLEVEAGFTAHCGDDDKPGKVNLEFHLSQDEAETYSYSCDGSTNAVSRCTGAAREHDVKAAVTAAVAGAAKELCKGVEPSLISVTEGDTVTDVRVKHLQKGEKVEIKCQSNHHL